jgi:UPF0755 protein
LFFVADGTGGHAFAENLSQHQLNVTKLRQFEQQARGTPATPDRANAFAEPMAPAAATSIPVPPPAAIKSAPAAKTKQGARTPATKTQ